MFSKSLPYFKFLELFIYKLVKKVVNINLALCTLLIFFKTETLNSEF